MNRVSAFQWILQTEEIQHPIYVHVLIKYLQKSLIMQIISWLWLLMDMEAPGLLCVILMGKVRNYS